MSWLMTKYVRGVERLFMWLAPELDWDDLYDYDEEDGD